MRNLDDSSLLEFELTNVRLVPGEQHIQQTSLSDGSNERFEIAYSFSPNKARLFHSSFIWGIVGEAEGD